MEFDDNGDDEEMGIPPDDGSAIGNAGISGEGEADERGGGGGGGGGVGYRYRECLKNHALSIGGNAVDGCCEFMASGEEGTLDALLCAACNCHRNFHRKELDGGGGGGGGGTHLRPPPHHQHIVGYRGATGPTGYLHVTRPKQSSRLLSLPSSPSSSGEAAGSKKRFRTKFSEEQKDKMLGFSESVGWRIQKKDEAAVEQFCGEAGVSRQVLKIWMHNNKHKS